MIKDHLVIAAELVKAAKAGDQRAAADAEKRWYANADEIVQFMHSINPHWTKDIMRRMFYSHLALTKAEAVAILSKDYKAGVDWYDKIEREILQNPTPSATESSGNFPVSFISRRQKRKADPSQGPAFLMFFIGIRKKRNKQARFRAILKAKEVNPSWRKMCCAKSIPASIGRQETSATLPPFMSSATTSMRRIRRKRTAKPLNRKFSVTGQLSGLPFFTAYTDMYD